jgi:allophanate hydrolase subunit 2
MIHVTTWGIGTTVVDAGRHGRAWLGAGRGGAVDLASFGLANRLVGNRPSLRAFETSGGLAVTFSTPTMVAVTGAVARLDVHDGPAVGWGNPVALPAGSQLRIGHLLDGARTYVAVRGGLAGAGDDWTVGPDPYTSAAEHAAPRPTLRTDIHVWPGPRRDWFVADAWSQLLAAPYHVTTTSRVGTRLSGLALARACLDELPSEGMVEGAVQVPPDGQPIVMLADHPTTGGYPVIAVVDPADLSYVAQAAPGTALRFVRS